MPSAREGRLTTRRCWPYAHVAQLVEQRTFNPWVGGSIPFMGTINNPKNAILTRFFARKCEKITFNSIRKEGDAMIIRPQPKQEEFLSSPADLVIYGGAAGGG